MLEFDSNRSTLYGQILDSLYESAKAADEFEYMCTLLNIEGMKSSGWFAETESQILIRDLMSFQTLPILDHAKIRLALLAYGHIVEMDIGYHFVANLLRITAGGRYSIAPLPDKNGKPMKYPYQKIARISKLAADLGQTDIPKLFDYYSSAIRNAVMHSNYALHEDRFNITRGKPLRVQGNLLEHSVKLMEEIVPRINSSLRFFSDFFRIRHERIASYQTVKTINGRLGAAGTMIPVTITVEEGYGLTGFTA